MYASFSRGKLHLCIVTLYFGYCREICTMNHARNIFQSLWTEFASYFPRLCIRLRKTFVRVPRWNRYQRVNSVSHQSKYTRRPYYSETSNRIHRLIGWSQSHLSWECFTCGNKHMPRKTRIKNSHVPYHEQLFSFTYGGCFVAITAQHLSAAICPIFVKEK